MPKKEKDDDIFNKENEVKPPFTSWNEPGDAYKGVLVLREIVPCTLPNKQGVNQAVYTFADAYQRKGESDEWKPIEGGILKSSGRGNRNPMVNPGLELCKMGQVVYLKFVETRKTKPHFNDAKIIRVYTKHEFKQEVLDEFNGVTNVEDVMNAQETVDKM